MNNNYNYKELCIKMAILIVIQSLVHHYPNLQKYNSDTRFNYYRSLMCLAFATIGLHIGLNHIQYGFLHPFSYYNNDINEVQYLFMAYLIIDILKLMADNSKRYDLYIHHLLCIATLINFYNNNKYGYLHVLLLICESISIVTGIDSMALEEDDKLLSYKCKKYRQQIIRNVRIPLWIILLLTTLKYTNRVSFSLWCNSIIISTVMIYLDLHWDKKCRKIIEQYEK